MSWRILQYWPSPDEVSPVVIKMTLREAIDGLPLPVEVEHDQWGTLEIVAVHENFAEGKFGEGYGLEMVGCRRGRHVPAQKEKAAEAASIIPHSCNCDIVSLLQKGCACGGV